MTTSTTSTAFPIVTCVLAPPCARCGNKPDYDDGEAHYSSIEQARLLLRESYGWTPLPSASSDGPTSLATADEWVCVECACAATGHTLVSRPGTGWFNPDTGVQYHPWQHCERCDAIVTRTDPTPAPAGYPSHRPAGYHGPSWDANALPEAGALAETFHTLIRQANGLFRLARLNAYLAEHPQMVIPDDGYPPPDLTTALAAADQLITLTTHLRNRLTESEGETA